MEDKEIIKALEKVLDKEQTILLSFFGEGGRAKVITAQDILDLINHQKAEIESLKHRKTELQIRNQELQHEKSEAIKEFAEGLCDGRVSNDPVVIAVKTELQMTEGQKK